MVAMFIDKKNISPMGILKLCEKFVRVVANATMMAELQAKGLCFTTPQRKQLANLYNIQLHCSLAKGLCHETANITNTSFDDFSVYQPPET